MSKTVSEFPAEWLDGQATARIVSSSKLTGADTLRGMPHNVFPWLRATKITSATYDVETGEFCYTVQFETPTVEVPPRKDRLLVKTIPLTIDFTAGSYSVPFEWEEISLATINCEQCGSAASERNSLMATSDGFTTRYTCHSCYKATNDAACKWEDGTPTIEVECKRCGTTQDVPDEPAMLPQCGCGERMTLVPRRISE